MAEIRRVLRETKAARNAHARHARLSRKEAERWCAEVGAEVQRWAHHGEWRWTVRVPGFHPVTSDTLERAVRALDATITGFCESRATHGPTGASLARYRALREGAPEGAEPVPGGDDAEETGRNPGALRAVPAR